MRRVVACVAIWLGLHGTALACDYPSPQAFEIQADEEDQEAPLPPHAKVEKVKRGKAPERDGCGSQESSCDDSGFVLIDLGLGGAESREVGYVFEVKGKHPSALDAFADRPLYPAWGGKLQLVWTDGEGHENYDFDIYVWSVDRAGNLSESPTKLHVENEGSDGCAARASSGRGDAPLPLLLTFWLSKRALGRARRHWRSRRRASVRS